MDFFKFSDDEIYAIAQPIMVTMKQGTNEKDYMLFSTHFSTQFKALVDETKFYSQVETNIPLLGLLTDQEYLGLIRRESGVSVIYKKNVGEESRVIGSAVYRYGR